MAGIDHAKAKYFKIPVALNSQKNSPVCNTNGAFDLFIKALVNEIHR